MLGQGYRNPALTAKIAASLQFLTGGRYILGIGAGWKEDEYRAYGYDFPPARVRIGQLEDAVQICKLIWTGGPVSYTGEYYQIENAYCMPAPEPPPPIMIGGAGEQRTLRVVAQYADWWNADYYSPDDYARKLAILREHCRAVGRAEDAVVPTCYMGVSISHDPSKLIRRPPVMGRPDMYVISGNPDEVTEQIEAVREDRRPAHANQLPRLPPHRRPRSLPLRCPPPLHPRRHVGRSRGEPQRRRGRRGEEGKRNENSLIAFLCVLCVLCASAVHLVSVKGAT